MIILHTSVKVITTLNVRIESRVQRHGDVMCLSLLSLTVKPPIFPMLPLDSPSNRIHLATESAIHRTRNLIVQALFFTYDLRIWNRIRYKGTAESAMLDHPNPIAYFESSSHYLRDPSRFGSIVPQRSYYQESSMWALRAKERWPRKSRLPMINSFILFQLGQKI
jgi:hypothetical protein